MRHPRRRPPSSRALRSARTEERATLGYRLNGGELQPLTIGPDGARLATAGNDNLGRVWDLDTPDATGASAALALEGHTQFALDVAYGPAGRSVASLARATSNSSTTRACCRTRSSSCVES